MRRVQVQVKMITRSRAFKRTIRTTQMIQKAVIRNSIYSVGPTALNDVLVHHAHLDLSEITKVAVDTLTVDGMTMLAIALSRLV
jgi:hypothetical protein